MSNPYPEYKRNTVTVPAQQTAQGQEKNYLNGYCTGRTDLLAEQAKQEPVAWMYDWESEGGVVRDWVSKDYDEAHSPTMGCHNIRALYTTPPAAQPAQDQEPCSKCHGLGYYDEGHENDDGSMSGGNYVECEGCKPPAAQPAVPAIPEGWKLVPVEPTEAMVRAGDQKSWVLPSRECWAAMLAAAPQKGGAA